MRAWCWRSRALSPRLGSTTSNIKEIHQAMGYGSVRHGAATFRNTCWLPRKADHQYPIGHKAEAMGPTCHLENEAVAVFVTVPIWACLSCPIKGPRSDRGVRGPQARYVAFDTPATSEVIHPPILFRDHSHMLADANGSGLPSHVSSCCHGPLVLMGRSS